MYLIILWVSFIFFINLLPEINQFQYFSWGGFMLGILLLYNFKVPTKISLRTAISILIIPNVILWYIVFIYNDFLSLTPIRYEIFEALFIIHAYGTIYLFFNRLAL